MDTNEIIKWKLYQIKVLLDEIKELLNKNIDE